MNRLVHLVNLGASYILKLTKPWNPPYQFSIEPTNSCNFRCVFCPQSDLDHKYNRKQGFLSAEHMSLFLERISEVKPGSRNISLTLDGEPSLNRNLSDLIRLINEQKMFPRFSSNGKNLTPEMADNLTESGDFLVAIDFASRAEYFDNVRGKEGDFDIVLENLRYLMNVAQANPALKMEIVNISHFSGADRDSSFKEMRSLFPKNLPPNITFWSREFHNFCGHLGINKSSRYILCPYPWTSFTVTWEGDVVPCCRDTGARTVLGNVFEQTIHDIWHGKKYQDLRTSLINKQVGKIEACKGCDLPWSGGTTRWEIQYVLSSLLRR